MSRFLFLALFILTSSSSFEQTSKFDELSNEMFFNILISKPDSCVYDFIKKYFPTFTEPAKTGGWTMYPPGPFPKLTYTIHSLKFSKHPYFDTKFREGRLDILASEQTEVEHPGMSDLQLWFMFDNKADAQGAFVKLCKMFESKSKSKKVFQRNGKKIAEYSDQPIFNSLSSVQFILTKDELFDGKYKLFFRIGSFTYSQ